MELASERIGRRNPDDTLDWPTHDLYGRQYNRQSPLSTVGIGKGQFVVVTHWAKDTAGIIEQLRKQNAPKPKAKVDNGNSGE